MAMRVSFDELIEQAELPDDPLPVRRSKLPAPVGRALSKGPAAPSCSADAMFSTAKPSLLATSLKAQLYESTEHIHLFEDTRSSSSIPQLLSEAKSLASAEEDPAARTPPRKHRCLQQHEPTWTPAPVRQMVCLQQEDQCVPRVGKRLRWKQPDLSRSPAGLDKKSSCKSRTQSNEFAGDPCCALVPVVTTGSRQATKRSLPKESAAMVSYTAGSQIPSDRIGRAGRGDPDDKLRGAEMVEVPLDIFSSGGCARPRRQRIPVLEFWRGEHIIYHKVPGVGGLTAQAVVLNRCGERWSQLALKDRETLLAIQDGQLAIEDRKGLLAIEDDVKISAAHAQRGPPKKRRRAGEGIKKARAFR